MKYKDYYAVLGVGKSASAEEIRNRFRELARKYHPDVNKEPGAEDRFKEVNEAYEVLKDPEKRRKYDALGAGWAHGQDFTPPPGYSGGYRRVDVNDIFGEGGGDFSDFFTAFFGGMPTERGRRSVARKGSDYEIAVELTVEELCSGVTREISYALPGNGGSDNRTLSVRIPAGVLPGQKVRLSGQGGAGAQGGPSGDIYLVIRLKPHPFFRLENRDIMIDLPVSPWEAALGAKVEIPSPLGGKIEADVPAGTSSGAKLRFKGIGVPNTSGSPGNMFAIVKIVLPPNLTEQEEKLMKELAQHSHFRPRPW